MKTMPPAKKKSRWATAVPSREEQHALKRLALVREAGRAFGRKGFHNTSMDDVAKVLNVTKPALYYYVKNKQEILYECHAYALDLGEQARAEAFAETSAPAERLRLLLLKFIELLTSKFGSYAVLSEPVSSLEPEYREKILARMRSFDRMCRELLEAAIADGSMPPCDVRLAIAFFMGAVNNITRWYSPSGPRSGKEIAEAFVGFILDGLHGGGVRVGSSPSLDGQSRPFDDQSKKRGRSASRTLKGVA